MFYERMQKDHSAYVWIIVKTVRAASKLSLNFSYEFIEMIVWGPFWPVMSLYVLVELFSTSPIP